ncbi:MAG: hypothetical protein AAFY60_16455 [Myxococcota bacterium]
MKLRVFAVVCLSFAVAAPAFAGVKEKKQMKAWEKEVKSEGYYETVKSKCGAEIAFSFDAGLSKPFVESNRSLGAVANAVYREIAALCGDDDFREAITAKFKTVRFKFKKDIQYIEMGFSKKSLVAHINPTVGNTNRKARAWLEDNL